MLLGSKGAARLALLGALFCFCGLLSAQQKIAVIDVNRIMEESIRGQALRASIEKIQAQKRDELSAQEAELIEVQKRYTQGRLSLAEDKLRDLRDEVELRTRELERAREDAGRELNKVQAEETQTFEAEVLPLINQVAMELGYSLVFQKYQSGLVFAADSIDITDLVLERFDQESGD